MRHLLFFIFKIALLIPYVSFSSSLIDTSKPIPKITFDVQGHRGAKGLIPPGNTLPAFKKAYDIGVNTLEADMRITQDNIVVLAHDDNISKHCQWTGDTPQSENTISNMTAAQLALWDCHKTIKGIQPYPQLTEIFDLYHQTALQYSLELKQDSDKQVEQYIQTLLDYNQDCQNCLQNKIILQCFTWSACEYAKLNDTYDLAFRISLLTKKNVNFNKVQEALSYADIYSPRYKKINANQVMALQQLGLQVIPWTVNSRKAMDKMINMGVDGIITDYPDRLIALLDDFTNLIANGDAEEEKYRATLPYWTIVSGKWKAKIASKRYIAPQKGRAFFFAGASEIAELYQDIDVSLYQESIAKGLQKFYFSGFLAANERDDFASIVVEYRNINNNVIQQFNSGEITSSRIWLKVEDTSLAPKDTTSIRIRLISTRNNGINNDGYYDNLILNAIAIDAK